MLKWFALLLLLTQAGFASSWQPSERFLSAVRYVESYNGQFIYGDGGQSLGEFQLSDAAWADVNAWRKARNLPVYAYNRHVFNQKINRLYASNYFSILHSDLGKKLNRAPSSGELYAAYNIGMGQFAQCNYKLRRVNPVTLKKCQQIEEIVDGRFPRN